MLKTRTEHAMICDAIGVGFRDFTGFILVDDEDM